MIGTTPYLHSLNTLTLKIQTVPPLSNCTAKTRNQSRYSFGWQIWFEHPMNWILQIISSGELLTLDLVRGLQNLKKDILAEKRRKDEMNTLKKNGKNIKYLKKQHKHVSSLGGFIAFWRSVDPAKTIKKVLFIQMFSVPLFLPQGVADYILTLPSLLKLGSPYQEKMCLKLLKRGSNANVKVEVFKRETQDSDQEFEIIHRESFPNVGAYYIFLLNEA